MNFTNCLFKLPIHYLQYNAKAEGRALSFLTVKFIESEINYSILSIFIDLADLLLILQNSKSLDNNSYPIPNRSISTFSVMLLCVCMKLKIDPK